VRIHAQSQFPAQQGTGSRNLDDLSQQAGGEAMPGHLEQYPLQRFTGAQPAGGGVVGRPEQQQSLPHRRTGGCGQCAFAGGVEIADGDVIVGAAIDSGYRAGWYAVESANVVGCPAA
jgi:hypothetical protein